MADPFRRHDGTLLVRHGIGGWAPANATEEELVALLEMERTAVEALSSGRWRRTAPGTCVHCDRHSWRLFQLVDHSPISRQCVPCLAEYERVRAALRALPMPTAAMEEASA